MKDEKSEYQNCVFCGQSDLIAMNDEGICYILCLTCHSCGPCTESEDEAFLLWNERFDAANDVPRETPKIVVQ